MREGLLSCDEAAAGEEGWSGIHSVEGPCEQHQGTLSRLESLRPVSGNGIKNAKPCRVLGCQGASLARTSAKPDKTHFRPLGISSTWTDSYKCKTSTHGGVQKQSIETNLTI